MAFISLHSCPLGNLGTRDTGGMSVYIKEVSRQFASAGWEVDIFTREHDSHGGDIAFLEENVRLIHLKAGGTNEAVNKVELYSHIDTFNSGISDFVSVNKINYKHIFSHYWLSGVSGQLLSADWHVPHTVMFHTLGKVKNLAGLGQIEPELRLQEENRIVKASDRIIAATDREKADLCSLYGADADKIRVVPCGVNPEVFKPGRQLSPDGVTLDRSTRTILYVGRIEPLKGTGLLIDALSLIAGDPKWRCVIVGGDLQSEGVSLLQQQAKKQGISDRLIFTGMIPQRELQAYYSFSSVLVLPSYYESFGLVAIEALACGCPVIAGDVGDLKNIIIPEKSGDILTDLSVGEMAAKISKWINKHPRSNSETRLISKSVAGLSWKNMSRALLNSFEQIHKVKEGVA